MTEHALHLPKQAKTDFLARKGVLADSLYVILLLDLHDKSHTDAVQAEDEDEDAVDAVVAAVAAAAEFAADEEEEDYRIPKANKIGLFLVAALKLDLVANV